MKAAANAWSLLYYHHGNKHELVVVLKSIVMPVFVLMFLFLA